MTDFPADIEVTGADECLHFYCQVTVMRSVVTLCSPITKIMWGNRDKLNTVVVRSVFSSLCVFIGVLYRSSYNQVMCAFDMLSIWEISIEGRRSIPVFSHI